MASGGEWAATVAVELRGGGVRTASCAGPCGQGARPASDADLLAKWRDLTGTEGGDVLERLREGDEGESFAAVLAELPGAAGLLG